MFLFPNAVISKYTLKKKPKLPRRCTSQGRRLPSSLILNINRGYGLAHGLLSEACVFFFDALFRARSRLPLFRQFPICISCSTLKKLPSVGGSFRNKAFTRNNGVMDRVMERNQEFNFCTSTAAYFLFRKETMRFPHETYLQKQKQKQKQKQQQQQ